MTGPSGTLPVERSNMKRYELDFIRSVVIGRDLAFKTPFGTRNLFYADYKASGRCLESIERKLANIERSI